jgi:hypothetical protein
MVEKSRSLEGCVESLMLLERYRCPEHFVNFVASGDAPRSTGYFKFGDDVICFGQISAEAAHLSPNEPLFDSISRVVVDDSSVLLPFDPAEVITNLRTERYREGTGIKPWPAANLIRNSYYMIRPLMPVRVRKRLQKLYFRGWQQISFPRWPVDVTVESIHENLLSFAVRARGGQAIPFIWFWPEGVPSCAIVTHDVETQSGLDFCSKLMDLNDSFGIKSSFQVVPEERYEIPEGFPDEVRARGFELNIHDLNHDGHLFRDKAEFLRRAARINQYAGKFGSLGFRSAILYRNLDWITHLEFMYDMSVPNVSHLDPQRGGCCTVLPYFVGNLVELPVTMTQDYTLFHILDDYSTDMWLEQSARIRSKNGMLSVIVHPDYLDSSAARDAYCGLMSHLRDLRSAGQTWIALPREVAAWWKQRSLMELIPSGDSWCIRGEGSERARLAYAVLDGNSLRYELAKV